MRCFLKRNHQKQLQFPNKQVEIFLPLTISIYHYLDTFFFCLTVPQIKSISRPSPPKKLKTAKPEKIQLEEEEEIEWVEENEPEELKRKVIPPKSVTVAVKPTIASAKASKKTSVFDRLGESNVSSTTPEVLDSPTSAAKAAVKVPNTQSCSYFPTLPSKFF